MGFAVRVVRVFFEVLIIVWYLEPMYKDLREKNPSWNLPAVDSLTGVFLVTLLSDMVVFQ